MQRWVTGPGILAFGPVVFHKEAIGPLRVENATGTDGSVPRSTNVLSACPYSRPSRTLSTSSCKSATASSLLWSLSPPTNQ